ncbi:Stp1/IreP family PP2C-type Ser/Thr phosphatase [Tumebacillus sp. ITR2]|uniref:Stp1/IreP family PP2C-type Ser/Thr phosphatase n=1 Tax=Tumebacillus amylolyticus TaxID=2801339 RepID=A0ABS1JEY1_9BACL|nr:Stp1/IreP family PP2C-type Ser/Thr phosphatase [Tumebacillus amylolyticus]MBL0388829.1 Stp1/IreP family PP2C-type Ser/Thr phosphatase [Tumebacillus amylolyticus]
MQVAAKTHVGLVRQLNEDSYAIVAHQQPHGVAVLADGMGGHLAGEVASALAVEAVVKHITEHTEGGSDDPQDLLVAAIKQANQAVHDRASSQQGLSGMGTTLIVSLFNQEQIYLGHIGDSRVYLLQGGELRQVTEDHTLVNELYKNGQITLEEALHHPQRNIVTRAVGTDERVQPDLLQLEWGEGDLLLICSDGLSNMVEERLMSDILRAEVPVTAKVDALLDKAIYAGGHDNITIILVQNQSDRGDAT